MVQPETLMTLFMSGPMTPLYLEDVLVLWFIIDSPWIWVISLCGLGEVMWCSKWLTTENVSYKQTETAHEIIERNSCVGMGRWEEELPLNWANLLYNGIIQY